MSVSQQVMWDDITGEDGYRVKWGTVTATYPNSADVGAGVTSYNIAGLTAGTTYYWVVVGLVSGVEQTQSSEASFVAGIPIGRFRRPGAHRMGFR